MGSRDSRLFAIDIILRAVLLPNIQDFVNFAHVEGIKKDQLGEAILGKDFFPKLN